MEEISIQSERGRFLEHLSNEDNKNIIFSGIFGCGKSYFLDRFFNRDETDKYNSIFIYPIHYSVATNEDIFEYIKVDILFSLLNKYDTQLNFEHLNFPDLLKHYIRGHLNSFLYNLLSAAEKIKYHTTIVDTIYRLRDSLLKYLEKIKNENQFKDDDTNKSFNFLEKYIDKKGSIYEDDCVTRIIRWIIDSIKADGKKIALIIDDLDRIDPEHIFRILNILSVHEQYGGEDGNKFDFDKTILVCDINNIRNIYKSKYGIDVDFNGYIDKFYNKEIFSFNINSYVIESLSFIMAGVVSNIDDFNLKNQDSTSYYVVKDLLSCFIMNGDINLRTLLKFLDKKLNYRNRLNYKGVVLYAIEYPGFIIFEFLRTLFNSSVDMIKAFEKYHITKIEDSLNFGLLYYFIPLADCERNNFKDGKYSYIYNGDKTFDYNIEAYAQFKHRIGFNANALDTLPLSELCESVVKKAFSNYIQSL